MTTYYRDFDGDGYADPSVTTQACSKPAGYILLGQADCCDMDGNAHPNSTWCSTTQTMCNVGSFDYNCDGLSTPVTCCQCDPPTASGTYCGDGWQGNYGFCTPNTVTTGSAVNCTDTIACVEQDNSCALGSVTCSGGSGACLNACQWLSTTTCGVATWIDYFACAGTYPACTTQELQDDTGYLQGCQ